MESSKLFERMSVRVIAGIAAETRRLIRAEGVITEIKSSGICRCEYSIRGSRMSGFYYVETLVSIEGPERGWLERFEVTQPQIPARSVITDALVAARQACSADDKDAILRLARGLCSCTDPCGDSCGSRGPCQRMLRIRDTLLLHGGNSSKVTTPEAVLLIEDYLTP